MDISDKLAESALFAIAAYCGQFDNTCEGCIFNPNPNGCILQDSVVPDKLKTYYLTGEEA